MSGQTHSHVWKLTAFNGSNSVAGVLTAFYFGGLFLFLSLFLFDALTSWDLADPGGTVLPRAR